MSSPNEPGQPATGERPANGEGPPDLPPWQGGARSRPDSLPVRAAVDPPRPPVDPPRPPVAQGAADPSRYVTGYAAPDLSAMGARSQRPEESARTDRTEVAVTEAFPSELPDLSASAPRVPQVRKHAAPDQARPAAPTSRLQVGGRPRDPVRASMQIRRIDPWSALKVSLLLNGALFFVWMIAVAFLYLVLGAMGVWSKLNSNVGDLLTSSSSGGGDLVSAGSVFGGAALVGLVNIVLLTAMATIGTYIYNLSTDIVGGVEVTLADLD